MPAMNEDLLDFPDVPAVGEVWRSNEDPKRRVTIIRRFYITDSDYTIPVSADIVFRRIGTQANGKAYPLAKTCLSAFTAQKRTIARNYNYPRYTREPLTDIQINDALLIRADDFLQHSVYRRAAYIQALRFLCCGAHRPVPRSYCPQKIAFALEDLWRVGLVVKGSDGSCLATSAFYNDTPLARHIVLLTDTVPDEGKTAFLTLIARHDAAIAEKKTE